MASNLPNISGLFIHNEHFVCNNINVFSQKGHNRPKAPREREEAKLNTLKWHTYDILYETICCMSFRVSFCSCVFQSFIAITSLGKERANLSAFRTFVRFVLVWICRFPLPLGVWEGLRFVIMALPGLFSYPFFFIKQ